MAFKKLALLALIGAACASPAVWRLTPRQMGYHKAAVRQNQEAAASGLSDLDILQLCVLSVSLMLPEFIRKKKLTGFLCLVP